MKNLCIISFIILFWSCNQSQETKPSIINESEIVEEIQEKKHLIHDYAARSNENINVVVEIPTGSIEKWEVNKSSGELEWEKIDGKPRKINYLGYPGNYGMIPQTILSKEQGGDGDPLDVIVIGPSVERGSVVETKLIGVLKILDKGEQDDKLIAVMEGTNFYEINSLNELNDNYEGVLETLKTFFSNYKGKGKMEFIGFGNENEAKAILNTAIESYQKSH